MHSTTPSTLRMPSASQIVAGLQHHLQPAFERGWDHDRLLQSMASARLLLLGEASHGTREFYRERCQLTRRLIETQGLHAVAVEADWPDAWRVHRYVQGQGQDRDAAQALSGFERFPAWMWRNTEVVEFVEWLRWHNLAKAPAERVGFYGLDLYSLFRSMHEVLTYLERGHPVAAARARTRYACFDPAHEDSQAYGYAAHLNPARSCEHAVRAQLRDIEGLDAVDGEELFQAQQNARLVRNAEAYYRTLLRGHVTSWNLRDSHMRETVLALDQHLGQRLGQRPRMALWAHNSHLGDAHATEMAERGEWNLGQLLREQFGSQVFSLGMSTYHGWVTAAQAWDAPPQRRRVRPGLPGSWESLLHQADTPGLLLVFKADAALSHLCEAPRLQRAIGVIYRPQTERHSHYFYTRLPQQFDALLHIDETHAVEPLEQGQAWLSGEAPETYPSGL